MGSRSEVRERLKKEREFELKKEKAKSLLFKGGIIAFLVVFTVVIVVFVNVNEKNKPTPADYKLGDSAAAASVSDDPYLQFGAKSDAPVVDLYLDFTCPYCGEFHEASGSELEDLARNDEVTLRVHPRNFLAAGSSTEYSTRAAIAFAAVYQDDPDTALTYMDTLFDDEPAEGTKGHSNKKLQEFADEAGSSADVTKAIEEGRGLDWLNDTVEAEARENTQGTPYIAVDGVPVENWRDTETLMKTIEGA